MAARGVSLALMLLATLCVYGMARRLAGPWAGVYGAAMFAVAQSTEALGNVATPDALALSLLALTGWLVIRSGTAPWLLLPAAFTTTAMIVTKYTAVLYLPTLILLAILVADQVTWRRACARGFLFEAGTAALSSAALYFLHAFDGMKQAILDQPKGTTPFETFADHTLRWAAPVLVLALIGVNIYASPLGRAMTDGRAPSNWRRLAIGLLLTVTALLAPLTQLWLRNDASLHKDIGFGLLFAAVMAGVMLVSVAKTRFIGPVLVLGLIGCALFNGFTESSKIFGTWPSTNAATASPQVPPESRA
jgi:4-amino-4-deoxy-L-arabinose transferase-like glycosyltransferase